MKHIETMLRKIAGTVAFYIGLVAACLIGAPAFAQPDPWTCGPLRPPGQFGPYDYRYDRGQPLGLVEGAHFGPEIEALIRGNRNHLVGPDIDYTLRAYPNHHRALIAMMRLGEKQKTNKPDGANYTVECYFERAVLFRDNDPTVRMLYAGYLSKQNRQSEALAQLARATLLAKDNGFTHYNIGLVYFDMKVYDRALAQAHRAIELDFERSELRDLLKNAGQWQEPVTTTTPSQ